MVYHIAGHPIVIQGRTIQRCMICGRKLLDTAEQQPYQGPNGHMFCPLPWQPFLYLSEDEAGKFVTVENPPEENELCLILVETEPEPEKK